MAWIDCYAALGIQGITLCDTTGMAYPSQVRAICAEAIASQPRLAFSAHFHNTRAMGLPSTLAAIAVGIRSLDMSLGGIGGCPCAPGASGNVATEDVVHLLACEGHPTGIDLRGLLDAAVDSRRLVQRDLPSQLSHAGPRLTRHEPPVDFPEIVARAQAKATA